MSQNQIEGVLVSQSRWDDILVRLTSRKFGLCVLMIALALIGFWSGNLTFEQLQTAALAAVGIYSATNAVETIATRQPAPAPIVTVEAAPAATPEMVAKNIAELVRAELDEMGAPSVTIKAGSTSITRRGTAEQTEPLMPGRWRDGEGPSADLIDRMASPPFTAGMGGQTTAAGHVIVTNARVGG